MQHLDRRRKLLGCLGIAMEHIADGQHQYRTDALAAAQQAVAGRAADLGFLRKVSIAGGFQCTVDPGKIFHDIAFRNP